MIAGWALIAMILMGLFAPFLSPYNPTIAGRDKDYENGAPQIPHFWDNNGFSFRPFIYATERERSIKTNFRWVTTVNREQAPLHPFLRQGLEIQPARLRMGPAGHDVRRQFRRAELRSPPVRRGSGPDPPVRHRCQRQGHLLAHAARDLDLARRRHARRLDLLRAGAGDRRCRPAISAAGSIPSCR